MKDSCSRSRDFLCALAVLIFLISLTLPMPIALAQATGGNWSGTLQQPNGPQDLYNYGMVLQEDTSGTVTGTSWATLVSDPEYYALWPVTGQFSNGNLTFQEGGLLSQNPPPGEYWCSKSGTLTLSSDGQALSGSWTAPGCAPGTITISTAMPPTSTSWYVEVTNADGCSVKIGQCPGLDLWMESEGAAMGNLALMSGGLENLLVILDFGQPAIKNKVYGATGFGHFLYPSFITAAVESYGEGFVAANNGASIINIVVGTTNHNLPTLGPAETTGHGMAWGQLVTAIGQQVKSYGAFNGQVRVLGGDDIELAWSSAALARSWVSGYAMGASPPYYVYDYGDSVDCPACGYGWTAKDVVYVSQGSGVSVPLPEIYNSKQAQQWQGLSLYSSEHNSAQLNIAGPLTQYEACIERPKSCHGNVKNDPPTAWMDLLGALDSTPSTSQGLIWSTDISHRIP